MLSGCRPTGQELTSILGAGDERQGAGLSSFLQAMSEARASAGRRQVRVIVRGYGFELRYEEPSPVLFGINSRAPICPYPVPLQGARL